MDCIHQTNPTQGNRPSASHLPPRTICDPPRMMVLLLGLHHPGRRCPDSRPPAHMASKTERMCSRAISGPYNRCRGMMIAHTHLAHTSIHSTRSSLEDRRRTPRRTWSMSDRRPIASRIRHARTQGSRLVLVVGPDSIIDRMHVVTLKAWL